MFGDMLFSNTHSVEQLVDIKKKKKVDRVLLKVLKTVRSRGNITSWIKPESDLRKEFNISDKAMNSICESLSDYYQVSLESASLRSVTDIVQFIKAHVATAADSIFLIDSSTLDVDEDGITEDPNGPKENLEVNPEIVKSSEPSNPTEEKVPEGTEASTEITDKDEVSEEIAKVEVDTHQKFLGDKYPTFNVSKLNKAIIKKLLEHPDLIEDTDKWIAQPDPKLLPSLIKGRDIINKIYGFGYTTGMKRFHVYRGFDSGFWTRRQQQLNLTKGGFWNKLKQEVEPGYKFTYKIERPLSVTTDIEVAKAFGAHILEATISTKDAFLITDELVYLISLNRIRNAGAQGSPSKLLTQRECVILPGATVEFTVKQVKNIKASTKASKENYSGIEFVDDQEPSQEIADVILGGVALAGIIASGIKLYKEKKMTDLCAWVNEHYSEVCSYIKNKMQGCDAFYKKRDTLWRVQDATDASESRIDQLNKIKSMPEPHAGEPPNLYKDRLKSHFGDKMENRIMPKNPAYLTIDEAGYLDASTTKEYVRSLSKAFDLQDEVDQKIDKIRHIPGGDSIRYINVLSEMNVMPFLHAMYKEQWTDNFNEHVLKVIAENVKKEDVTKSDNSSQEAYSVENISVPKEKYNLYKKMETPESIAEAEKKIGFTFGKQTKNLFLHFNGIYYGTWEFMDLEEADGNTHATYEADDRLKGKTIDKLFIARDGFGNYLSVDANDRVYIYQHDAEPAFKSESKLLDNFINEDYKKYEKYKSSKNKDVVADRGRLKETNKLGAKSVESFSMENLQTSQPSGDWGSMLNSF